MAKKKIATDPHRHTRIGNPILKTTATLLTDNNGTIQGLMHGYNIPVEEKSIDNIFFIDNILTTQGLPVQA
ncbi:hypothetical protein KAI46_03995, partial [bacterium]|nr:hypothetical protein [bacterium]